MRERERCRHAFTACTCNAGAGHVSTERAGSPGGAKTCYHSTVHVRDVHGRVRSQVLLRGGQGGALLCCSGRPAGMMTPPGRQPSACTTVFSATSARCLACAAEGEAQAATPASSRSSPPHAPGKSKLPPRTAPSAGHACSGLLWHISQCSEHEAERPAATRLHAGACASGSVCMEPESLIKMSRMSAAAGRAMQCWLP